jgi:hypothetical protein
MAQGSRVRYEWTIENDAHTREVYGSQARIVPRTFTSDGRQHLFDRDSTDLELVAGYPGVHRISVSIFLNDELKETVSIRQAVIEGDARILAMSGAEKLSYALSQMRLWDEIKHQVGNPLIFAGQLILVAGVIKALTVLTAGVAILGNVVSVIVAGLIGLVVADMVIEVIKLSVVIIRVQHAGTEEDILMASRELERIIVKLGIRVILAITMALARGGLKKAIDSNKQALEQGRVSLAVDGQNKQVYINGNHNSKIGWKIGDPVDNLTNKGDYPSWSTVKIRYWKNVAQAAESGEYSILDLSRMQRGC